MKNSKKGFAPLILIIIVVVIIGGGYYFITKSKEIPNQNFYSQFETYKYASTTKYKNTVKPTGPNGTFTESDALKEIENFGFVKHSVPLILSSSGSGTSTTWHSPFMQSDILKHDCPAPYGEFYAIVPVHSLSMSAYTGEVTIESRCDARSRNDQY